MFSAKYPALSEIAFLTYRTVLTVLTAIVLLRILFEYEWSQAALYGVATVCSFFIGQGIVGLLQKNRNQEPVRQENKRR